MSPMLAAMLVGCFFIIACVAGPVTVLPVAYMLCCLIRRQFLRCLVVLATGAFFGFLSIGVGIVMIYNVVGAGIMQYGVLGAISWFLVGFAGPALVASCICLVSEFAYRRKGTRPHLNP